MKKIELRILSLFLSLAMIFSLQSVISYAENSLAVDATVTQYICAPSQYTNSSAFGTNIQGTTSGTASTTSLGNFGGYAIYEFDKAIQNNANNLYGIDFIVTGNAFNDNATTQEPGQIWVSQDGIQWYAIAGSEHYEDTTDWNYSVTYNNTADSKMTYSDCYSESGIVSSVTAAKYPSQGIYKTVNIPDDCLTLNGILLAKQRTASTSNGIKTSFGYTDTRIGEITSTATNPYSDNLNSTCKDGQIDISLAVDSTGKPANLEWIKYVKVQTATFIDGAIFGEKSTEINAITLASSSEKAVGISSVPTSITIGSQKIDIKDTCNTYNVNVPENEPLTVTVESKDNVYINNQYTTNRTFETIPNKGIIRILVQSENHEPVIYYFNINNKTKSATVSFECSDSQIIMPKQSITAYDGIAEEYGYTVEKKDHNGIIIDDITLFDLLVAAHKEYYGDVFTHETAENYLVMNDSFITKAYGKSASASGFIIDGVMPNDGIVNETYGTYTGYSCDTARINDGSEITYYFYQDKEYWSDFYSTFDKGRYTVSAGETLSLNVNGYCAMYYGINDIETINEKYMMPITDGKIFVYDDGNSTQIGRTDSNGNASITFRQTGSYSMYVTGTTKDAYGETCPVIISWCTVNVTENQVVPEEPTTPSKQSFLQKVLSFFKFILSKLKNFFNFIISLY